MNSLLNEVENQRKLLGQEPLAQATSNLNHRGGEDEPLCSDALGQVIRMLEKPLTSIQVESCPRVL